MKGVGGGGGGTVCHMPEANKDEGSETCIHTLGRVHCTAQVLPREWTDAGSKDEHFKRGERRGKMKKVREILNKGRS